MARDINSIMAGWVDRGPWQYWDTLTLAAGLAASSYNLFSVPIGQVDPVTAAVKTKLDTNMVRGNQFPPPRCLVLMQLGFYFGSEMLKSDIDLILNGAYFEFRIDEKIFFEGHLWQAPPGTGLVGHSNVAGESHYTLGQSSPMLTRRYGEFSKYIAPLQQFSLSLILPGTPPTLVEATNLVVFLDGLTDRAVQ